MRTPVSVLIISAFLVNTFGLTSAQAQELILPKPGIRVGLSRAFNPPVLKGIKVHPDTPFRFDFILDKGDESSSEAERESNSAKENLKQESTKLIKYFLASLTVPEKDLWVNLSPYEKDRIVPQSFGLTEMGRDLLAQDYLLKQITASLIYPEDEFGKIFWNRVYEEARKNFGTTNIPVNTFNKVWIVPEKAVVYENASAGTAYVVESKLKVMLEQDYLALEKNSLPLVGRVREGGDANAIGSQIVREIVIPQLTKEINENKNFAQLRQVYNSLILATWYKKKIKDSILNKVYADRNKVQGVNIDDPQEKQKIYQLYLQAFKKGVYNYIKEEQDPLTQQMTSRKYFSGGFGFNGMPNILQETSKPPDAAMTGERQYEISANLLPQDQVDQAMSYSLPKLHDKATTGGVDLFIDHHGNRGFHSESLQDIAYDVMITHGLFGPENYTLAKQLEGKKAVFVLDRPTEIKYGSTIRFYIDTHRDQYHINAKFIVLKEGEEFKNMEAVLQVEREAKEFGIERRSILVGVGGVEVLEIVGVAAKLYRRMVPYIRVPTTLLGQVDTSVSGKVAVNSEEGKKNVLGSFYPPLMSINDLDFLHGNDRRQIQNGLAEIIKFGVAKDPRIFSLLERHYQEILDGHVTSELKTLLELTIQGMMEEIQPNVFETNQQRAVHFGHEISNFLEETSGFHLGHGEALAIGMGLSSHIAHQRGWLSEGDFRRIISLIKKIGLPIHYELDHFEEVVKLLDAEHRKKAGELNIVLPVMVGSVGFADGVSVAEIKNAFDALKIASQEDWPLFNSADVPAVQIQDNKSGKGHTIVFDIGGTHFRGAILTPEGTLLNKPIRRKTPSTVTMPGVKAEDLQHMLVDDIVHQVIEFKKENPNLQLSSVAISLGGPVREDGVVLSAAPMWGNAGHNFPMLDELQKRLSAHWSIANDITAVAHYYSRVERYKSYTQFGVITVSSGVGSKVYDRRIGGVLIDKEGNGGEMGHTRIDFSEDAVECDCGGIGHVASMASGRAALRIAKEMAIKQDLYHQGTYLYQHTNGIAGQITNEMIAQAAKAADPLALKVLDQVTLALAQALSQLAGNIGIEHYIIRGGFAIGVGESYIQALRKNLVHIGIFGRTAEQIANMVSLGEQHDDDGLVGMGYYQWDREALLDGGVRKLKDKEGNTTIHLFSARDIKYDVKMTQGIFNLDNETLAEYLYNKRVMFVLDQYADQVYGAELRKYLEKYKNKYNFMAEIVPLSAGEEQKTMDAVLHLDHKAVEFGLGPHSLIIGVGGGVILDIVGLAAHLHRRNTSYIRIATTLLAQVDAAVGIKTGVNFSGAKNLLGAFYPPVVAINDSRFLSTLGRRQLRGGLAEIIKMAIIRDRHLFELVEQHYSDILDHQQSPSYQEIIELAVKGMMEELQPNLFESRLERIVDFGHEFSNMLEMESHYELQHGEAVAVGMAFSSSFAYQRGQLPEEDFLRIISLLQSIGLPVYHPSASFENLQEAVREAQRHRAGHLNMVLPVRIGEANFTQDITEKEMNQAIHYLRDSQEMLMLAQKVQEPGSFQNALGKIKLAVEKRQILVAGQYLIQFQKFLPENFDRRIGEHKILFAELQQLTIDVAQELKRSGDPLAGPLLSFIRSPKESVLTPGPAYSAAVRTEEKGSLIIEQRPTPTIAENELLVAPVCAGICGTDIRNYTHDRPSLPGVVGHEVIAQVLDIGRSVEGRFKRGEFVVLNPNNPNLEQRLHIGDYGDGIYGGVFRVPSDFVTHPDQQALISVDNEIRQGMSIVQGMLIEQFSSVYHTQSKIAADIKGKTVAVLGAGPTGLFHVMMAQINGAQKVLLINRSSPRLDFAVERGVIESKNVFFADQDLNQHMVEATQGKGVDVVINTAGFESLSGSFNFMAREGTMLIYSGMPVGQQLRTDDRTVDLYNLRHNALTETVLMQGKRVKLVGAFGEHEKDMLQVRDLIATKQLDPSRIVTHIVSLEALPEVFRQLAQGQRTLLNKPVMKVIIDFLLKGPIIMTREQHQELIADINFVAIQPSPNRDSAMITGEKIKNWMDDYLIYLEQTDLAGSLGLSNLRKFFDSLDIIDLELALFNSNVLKMLEERPVTLATKTDAFLKKRVGFFMLRDMSKEIERVRFLRKEFLHVDLVSVRTDALGSKSRNAMNWYIYEGLAVLIHKAFTQPPGSPARTAAVHIIHDYIRNIIPLRNDFAGFKHALHDRGVPRTGNLAFKASLRKYAAQLAGLEEWQIVYISSDDLPLTYLLSGLKGHSFRGKHRIFRGDGSKGKPLILIRDDLPDPLLLKTLSHELAHTQQKTGSSQEFIRTLKEGAQIFEELEYIEKFLTFETDPNFRAQVRAVVEEASSVFKKRSPSKDLLLSEIESLLGDQASPDRHPVLQFLAYKNGYGRETRFLLNLAKFIDQRTQNVGHGLSMIRQFVTDGNFGPLLEVLGHNRALAIVEMLNMTGRMKLKEGQAFFYDLIAKTLLDDPKDADIPKSHFRWGAIYTIIVGAVFGPLSPVLTHPVENWFDGWRNFLSSNQDFQIKCAQVIKSALYAGRDNDDVRSGIENLLVTYEEPLKEFFVQREKGAGPAANPAKTPEGGIDFKSDKVNSAFVIKTSGEGIKFHIDPVMLEQLQNVPGFIPVIINIQPMNNIREFLGLSRQAETSQLAGV